MHKYIRCTNKFFQPNKRHLRDFLIYFFNLKKSAAEAYRLLVEKYYGEDALSGRSSSGRPKVYEDAELEA